MVDGGYDGCWDFISYIWLLGLYITVEKKLLRLILPLDPLLPLVQPITSTMEIIIRDRDIFKANHDNISRKEKHFFKKMLN